MKKVFIDCGMREGDAISAFLGDRTINGGAYYDCLKPRDDASEFEFIGFESADYKRLEETRRRFSGPRFSIIDKLVWLHDGLTQFLSDGESMCCRLHEVSWLENQQFLEHYNPLARVVEVPCIDFATFLLREFSADDFIIVKMDIEGAEYDVLHKIVETNAINLIDELYVEYHWWGNLSLKSELHAKLSSQPGLYYRHDWP